MYIDHSAKERLEDSTKKEGSIFMSDEDLKEICINISNDMVANFFNTCRGGTPFRTEIIRLVRKYELESVVDKYLRDRFAKIPKGCIKIDMSHALEEVTGCKIIKDKKEVRND